MAVLYADLEEKSVPVFVQGPGLVLAQGQSQGTSQPQQQSQGQTGQVQQAQGQRGSFSIGLTGL
jgi:CCR4-NOT transcription complex subunit 2